MNTSEKDNQENASTVVNLEAGTCEAALIVAGVAYRNLADAGLRTTLATLLPQSGPLTLPQAEAWLESTMPDGDEDWTKRIAITPDGLLPVELLQQWRALIVAEAGLARGATVDERAFESLIASVDEQPAGGYAEAERRRLAARA